jgi:hypothetical protein
MDSLAQQMAYEYAAFRNGYFPSNGIQMPMMGVNPTAPGQQMQYYPGMQEPAGLLTPAPEDAPWRPAINIDKEHLLNGMKGFGIATIAYLTLRYQGLLLWIVIAIATVLVLYKAVGYKEDVTKFKQSENFRLNGRLLPEARPLQHYVIQQPF